MTLFEEYIYWTDWETKSINRAHKTLGTNKTTLISTLHRPMDIHIYHPYRQPAGDTFPQNNENLEKNLLFNKIYIYFNFIVFVTDAKKQTFWVAGKHLVLKAVCLSVSSSVLNHPCQTDNGGCSNLCLLSPGGGYKCACPTNFYLASDQRTCISNCTASQVWGLKMCHHYCCPFSFTFPPF